MYKIENGYSNLRGQTFEGLRTIHVENISNLPSGKLLIYSEISENNYYFDYESRLNTGVMINQSLINPKQAFRIYKDWPEAWYHLKKDDELVYNLQKCQDKIKLTDFPTGIIAVDNFLGDYKKNGIPKVVGQEIPFYENSISLGNYFSSENNFDYIKIYLDALKILKELLYNGIYYSDIHVDNFVIDKVTKIVKLIDFEPSTVQFDVDLNALKTTLDFTKNLIIRLCEIGNVFLSKKISNITTLNELEEFLNDEHKKVLKH